MSVLYSYEICLWKLCKRVTVEKYLIKEDYSLLLRYFDNLLLIELYLYKENVYGIFIIFLYQNKVFKIILDIPISQFKMHFI